VRRFTVVSTSVKKQLYGPIGMALNGVPIYNIREGECSSWHCSLTTFDYSGHIPGPGKDYHYHTTGRYTTQCVNLLGVLEMVSHMVERQRWYIQL
jgi:hypothetical protein